MTKFKHCFLATLGMTRGALVAMTLAAVALASPRVAASQGKADQAIPASSRPPAGMCRIWLDNVPAAQQPAPTDCATAVRNRPAKGRVIFGDDYATKKPDSARATTKTPGAGATTKANSGIKGFAPSQSKATKKRPLVLP